MNLNNEKFSNGDSVTHLHAWVSVVRISDATDEDLMKARQFSVMEGIRKTGQHNGAGDSFIALAEIFEGELGRRHDLKRFEAQISSSRDAGRSSRHALWAVCIMGGLQIIATIFQTLYEHLCKH